jgi:hypothetical protein
MLCGTANPAGATTLVAGPNILHNGTFTVGNHGAYDPKTDNNVIPGWTVMGVYVHTFSLAGNGIQPPPGATYLVSLGRGTLSQVVRTTPGWTYLLQWYESGYPNYEGGTWTKRVAVTWGGKLVAAPTFNAEANTSANMRWALHQEVLTATTTSTVLSFADATKVPPGPDGYRACIGAASLAGDAKLYLPTSLTTTPTGSVLAIVRTATGQPLTDPALKLSLYGTYKETAYAPAVTVLMASGAVANGQLTLHLHLRAAMAGHTVPAYVTMSGPQYIPVTEHLKIKVS